MIDKENLMDSDKKTVYEIGYLLISTIPEENILAQVTAIKDTLDKSKAEVISEESPKLRPLAYKIKKKIGTVNQNFDTAYFGWVKFEAMPEAAIEIKKNLNAIDSILRFLLVITTRENTLAGSKVPRESTRTIKKESEISSAEKPKPKMSEAEIEKTIEELVVGA